MIRSRTSAVSEIHIGKSRCPGSPHQNCTGKPRRSLSYNYYHLVRQQHLHSAATYTTLQVVLYLLSAMTSPIPVYADTYIPPGVIDIILAHSHDKGTVDQNLKHFSSCALVPRTWYELSHPYRYTDFAYQIGIPTRALRAGKSKRQGSLEDFMQQMDDSRIEKYIETLGSSISGDFRSLYYQSQGDPEFNSVGISSHSYVKLL